MTGIELLRKFAETRPPTLVTCRQLPDALGKKCDDFKNCSECHRFVCNAIADQIEREIDEAVNDGTDDEDDAFGDMRGARTGIEMLRSYVHHARVHVRNLYINHVADINAVPLYEKLRECLRQLDEIADRIERETLPRPRFEDGEPVDVGSYIGEINGTDYGLTGEPVKRFEISAVHDSPGGEWVIRLEPGQVVKRPEPPDTWEKIEADVVKGDACRYFGISDEAQQECRECEDCPARYSTANCGEAMAADVLRRCKKLAGVEE